MKKNVLITIIVIGMLLSACAKNELSSASSTSKIEVENSNENTLETSENNNVNTSEENDKKIENAEENYYSEREIWEEFKKRGFKEDNIEVMNFFGEQDPETIYTQYNTEFEFNFEQIVEKDSEKKHPEYHFLYSTGERNWGINYEEEADPSSLVSDDYQLWYIVIYGKAWYAQSMGNMLGGAEGDGLVLEEGPCLIIGKIREEDNWGLIEVDCDSVDITAEVPHKTVKKITPEILSELAKSDFKLQIDTTYEAVE